MSGYDKLKRLILGKADEILEDEQRREILHNRLAKLTRRQMRMLALYYFESKSVRTIAKIMRTSKSTVSRQINSVIRKLRITSDEPQGVRSEPPPPPQSQG